MCIRDSPEGAVSPITLRLQHTLEKLEAGLILKQSLYIRSTLFWGVVCTLAVRACNIRSTLFRVVLPELSVRDSFISARDSFTSARRDYFPSARRDSFTSRYRFVHFGETRLFPFPSARRDSFTSARRDYFPSARRDSFTSRYRL
eukprot:1597923-Pyramimonas_sp.AAC.1